METDEESDQEDLFLPYDVEVGLEKWGGVEGLSKLRLDEGMVSRLERLYSLLSARGRIEIIYFLNFTPMTPGLISRLTNMAPNLTSFHLGKLERLGVVEHRKEGKHLVYVITELGESLLGPLQG